MFEFLHSLEAQLKMKRLLEFFVALVVVLVLVAIAMSVFDSGSRVAPQTLTAPYPSYVGGSSSGSFSYEFAPRQGADGGSLSVNKAGGPELSTGNVVRFDTAANPQGTEAQTRAYRAEFRTTDVAHTCTMLKQLEGIQGTELVQSNISDSRCSLRYRVEKNSTQAFVNELVAQNPERLVEDIENIEESVRDFSGARTTLEKKQALLTETLETSTTAFDELIALATERGDAEALSTAISGKLAHLERLTREGLMVEEELRTLDRRLTKELERVRYSFFDLTVSAYPHLPLTELKESWAQAMRELAIRTNGFVQGATVGLVVVLLLLAQVLLYIGVVFLLGRFVYTIMRPHLAGWCTPSSAVTTKQHTVARTKKPVA